MKGSWRTLCPAKWCRQYASRSRPREGWLWPFDQCILSNWTWWSGRLLPSRQQCLCRRSEIPWLLQSWTICIRRLRQRGFLRYTHPWLPNESFPKRTDCSERDSRIWLCWRCSALPFAKNLCLCWNYCFPHVHERNPSNEIHRPLWIIVFGVAWLVQVPSTCRAVTRHLLSSIRWISQEQLQYLVLQQRHVVCDDSSRFSYEGYRYIYRVESTTK